MTRYRRVGAHGGPLFSLSCRWTFFLYMALVLQLGQPVRARPLPGLCPGRLTRTSSCGKCVCPVRPLLVFFVKVVAGKARRPPGRLFLSCSVLLGRLSLDLWWEIAILGY